MADAASRIWLDGELLPADEARISVLDRGLLVGEGAFETLVAAGGRARAITRHLARLRRSVAALGLHLPWPDDALRAAVDGVVEGVDVARVRITVTGGPAPLGPTRPDPARPTVTVIAGPFTSATQPERVGVSPWPINERSPLAGVKTTSRAELTLALAAAQGRGFGEALLGNTAGQLVEGTGSNVFVAIDGRLLTPELASGCLPGVTRALVMEVVDVDERALSIDVLATADEVFLTSSTRAVQPVIQVEGRELGRPGPLTARAARALSTLFAANDDP